MAMQTVFVQELLKSGDPFSIEMPPNAVTGHPYVNHASPLAIMNETGSGKIIKLRIANLRPNTGPNALNGIVSVRRITSVSGGYTTVPFKFDSTNSDLPSQVEAGYSPSSVVLVGGGVIKRSTTLSLLNPTRALAGLCSASNGDARSGMDSGEFIRLTGDAQVTGYILREGEGLALVYDTDSASHCYAANLRFKVVSTGASYRLSEVIEPRFMAGNVGAYLINKAGSGVVLEVEKIQIREIGTDEIVIADYQIIDGLEGGEIPNYVMADTATSLPSGITIRRNCVTARAGSKIGALITLPSSRKVVLSEPPYGVGISGGPQIARRGIMARDFDMEAEPVVLREGQGFGIFLRSAGAQLCHEAIFVFDIIDAYPTAQEIAEAVWTRTGRTLT